MLGVSSSICHALPITSHVLQAIAAWRDNSDYGRCTLVKSYFAAAGGFGPAEVIKQVQVQPSSNPLAQAQLWAERLFGGGNTDPFFAVVANKL